MVQFSFKMGVLRDYASVLSAVHPTAAENRYSLIWWYLVTTSARENVPFLPLYVNCLYQWQYRKWEIYQTWASAIRYGVEYASAVATVYVDSTHLCSFDNVNNCDLRNTHIPISTGSKTSYGITHNSFRPWTAKYRRRHLTLPCWLNLMFCILVYLGYSSLKSSKFLKSWSTTIIFGKRGMDWEGEMQVHWLWKCARNHRRNPTSMSRYDCMF